jgi:Flp pilus assembly protein protease CpaA
MSGEHEHDDRPKLSRSWIAFAVFAGAIALLLIYEHRVHLLTGPALLLGLLAACIGMHLFMHGGHGGGGKK